jgi:D-arabinose 1-dehydrogenase-like Zn-dependent alcohol dehydrogenase
MSITSIHRSVVTDARMNISGGWGEAPMPICVGHEVIGKAVRVGKDVKTVKVGGM